MTARHRRTVAILGGAALLVGAVALLLTRGSGQAGPGGAPAHTEASERNAGAGAAGAPQASVGVPGGKGAAVEAVPMPGCWEGLLEFDRSVTLDTFQAAVRQAAERDDKTLAAYLQEKLTELIGNDPAKALRVVEWAESASGVALNVYIEGLKHADAVQDGRVVDRLLEMGERPDGDLVNRSAALDALETQHRLGADARARIKRIALDDRVDSTAWVAARTLGRVMKEDFERTGSYQPYWQDLLEVAQRSEDPAVRALALEMPSYSDPILDAASIPRLAKLMQSDREKEVREMAAFRLAVTEAPDKALEAYRAAFATEHELCVRWAIFRFAVRAAGADALPQLARWAQLEPRLKEDYLDFKKLYDAGETDFARVWMGKPERIQCIGDEEGAN